MILHIPHSSKVIPMDVRGQFGLSDEDLATEIIRMTDSYTDELFSTRSALSIIFPVSRLVVDPERFLNDEHESMAALGMGVVYTKTSQGTALRGNLTPDEKNRLIDKYYVPHHDKLTQAVKVELETDHRCFIIDCHSFPSIPWPCELDQTPNRPDICIGTDEFHTPKWLREIIKNALTLWGFKTKFNSPYPGTIVPLKYYRVDAAVSTIMVEINRSLYMDEKTGDKIASFGEIRQKINTILNILEQMYINHR